MGIFDFLSGSNDDSRIHDDEGAGRTYPGYPHSSKAEPSEHIDTQTYRDGKREPENETHHLTDKGHVMWGKKAKEWNEKQKDE